jgi:hypothetical protein
MISLLGGLAMLTGCIVVEQVQDSHEFYDPEIATRPYTFSIAPRASGVGRVTVQVYGTSVNDDGIRTTRRDDRVDRVHLFISEALRVQLVELGWEETDLTSELMIHCIFNESIEVWEHHKDSSFHLTLTFIDQVSGDPVFRTFGNYEINEGVNQPIADMIVTELLQPLVDEISLH